MKRKRSSKNVLTTGKKSKKYYERRQSNDVENEDFDFNCLPSFSVDFHALMKAPLDSTDETRTRRFDKVTQTGVPRSSHSCQTNVAITSRYTQTGPLENSAPKKNSDGEKLLNDLEHIESWENFAQQLSEKGQKNSFISLITALGKCRMRFENLSWKSTLDMGKLSLCTSTTNMSYDTDCVEFFSLFALMFGSSAVDVLRGPGNFSQVITEKTRRGVYDPTEGHFNFAIPSITTLKKVSSTYPKNIPVGIVEHSMKIAEENVRAHGAQYVLGFDGKLVSPGCKGDDEGDINLWGREKPSLVKTVDELQSNTHLAETLKTDVTPQEIPSILSRTRALVDKVTLQLKSLRERIESVHYMKKRLIQTCTENPANQMKYMRRVSLLHQNSADCEAVFKYGLSSQTTLLEIASIASKCHTLFKHTGTLDLSEQANVFQLLPPEILNNTIPLSREIFTKYIKQGSEMWHKERKKARVTGSTLYKAVGLDTLSKQKDHHAEFVMGRTPQPFEPDVQKRLDHGLKHEKNVIATLVALIMPAMLPPCFAYFEVGPMFIHSNSRRNLIEVSPDGVLKCTSGSCCPYAEMPRHKTIAIEVKSPFPTLENPRDVYYSIPVRYVTQLLAEMIVLETDEAWLLCGGTQSVVVMQQKLDKRLWQDFFAVAEELYAVEKPNVPNRLNPLTRQLRDTVAKFSTTNSVLLCEVPIITGRYGTLKIDPDVISPYAVTANRKNEVIDFAALNNMTKVASAETVAFLGQAHTSLRNQAHEVVVFMITEKNRIQHDSTPYAYPVAYALKGSSMNNADLRYLVKRVREEFLKRNIPILCEVYDGQWQQYITSDSNGSHLTKLHGRNAWNKISNYTKDKCLEEMADASVITTWHLDLLRIHRRLESGEEINMGNACVWKCQTGRLHTQSKGGKHFDEPVISKFVSVTEVTRPDLFPLHKEEKEISVSAQIGEEHAYCVRRRPAHLELDDSADVTGSTEMEESLNTEAHSRDLKNKRKEVVRRCTVKGLQPGERDLLCLLDKEMVETILQSNEENDTDYDSVAEESLSNVLLDPRCDLINDIHAHLIYNDTAKWASKNQRDIYPLLLTDGESLLKNCTVAEIKTICGVIEHHTKRKWFISGAVKAVNVNVIVLAFGGSKTVAEESARRQSVAPVFNPVKLATLAKNYMKKAVYEKIRLTVALGTVVVCFQHRRWLRNATVLLEVDVPGESKQIQLFAYPERNNETKVLELRTFDYTHILTNMRSHVLSRGYDFCHKEHFQHLIDNSNILSRYMVEYKMDIQNAFSAEKLFGYNVEKYMEENGFKDTAKFIQLVRMWHEACDKRGILAAERVRRLCKMHEFITNGINFTSVPFQYEGRYIKGMTWQIFEALLQNISTRIQLYAFAVDGTYNTRAVSTLANESFFADLVQLEKEGKGYPKACNIGRVMGQVVHLNFYKHKCDKNYVLGATRKKKYPVHIALENELALLDDDTEATDYKNHFFDYPDTHKSFRVRRRDITTGIQSLRSVTSLRTKFYKTDESKILPEVRAGNKPKGFVI